MVPSLRFSLQQCKVKMVLVFLCSRGHAFVLFSCSPSPSVTWAGDWWDHLNLLQPITHQLPFQRLAVASLQCWILPHSMVCAVSRTTPRVLVFPLFLVSERAAFLLWQ